MRLIVTGIDLQDVGVILLGGLDTGGAIVEDGRGDVSVAEPAVTVSLCPHRRRHTLHVAVGLHGLNALSVQARS